jgi:Transposase DDE domain/SWIM zinc finger
VALYRVSVPKNCNEGGPGCAASRPPNSSGWDRAVQRCLDDFSNDFRRTDACMDPGSNDQVIVSPSSRPRAATMGRGTVVRSDADRSIAFTSLDSNDVGTGSGIGNGHPPYQPVGQLVGIRIGSNFKYSDAVGRLIGRQMVTLPPRMESREIRALEMLRGGSRVAESSRPGEYVVASQTGKGLYTVRIPGPLGGPGDCTCPDYSERRAPCKHMHLVRRWLSSEGADRSAPSLTHGLSPPVPRKRNWALYDQSQTEEYRLFRTLLRDLSLGFTEPTKDPTLAGRKPIPLREQAYYAVQRSYLGFSLRRSQDFREQSVAQGLLSDAHFWALPSRFLCREGVTEGLHDMLARSAIPLIGLEDRCAIDSTGLRTTRFNYYRKEKYDPSRENVWLKFHALVGVKTHGIPVLEVTAGSAGDSPQYSVLLKRAVANGFRFKEAYADKAYQGRENFNTAAELEVVPFIPFKSNQTGQSKGSPMYHKMFLFFQYHREEFDQHYGQRAQVESTFGAFKQKLSETVASKKFTSQVNEVLCMAIAYNITVLVRQMFESGILPDFLRPPANVPTPIRPEALLENSPCLIRPPLDPSVTLSALPR